MEKKTEKVENKAPAAERKSEIPKLFVSIGVEEEIKRGLYVLSARQVEKIKGEAKAGDLSWAVDGTGKFIAQAFINPQNQILAQIVSLWEKEKIDDAFFQKKILAADEFRRKGLGLKNSYRLFYGEADGIPGLVVDRFENICSLQISCPGVEKWKQKIADFLLTIEGITTVVERNDFRNREKLGLEAMKGVLAGNPKVQTVISEGDVKFEVDAIRGHKTGFYLDQTENRLALEKYCSEGTQMLDVFSYTGGFGLHAAVRGANVVMIDLPEALGQAKRNAALNNVESKITFLEGRAIEETKKMISNPKRYDIISVDPPAFVQKPSDIAKGKSAYHQINYNCMKLLKENGILVTSSCSAALSLDEFISVLSEAANHAAKRAEIVEVRFQSRDHIVPAHTKRFGSYLKCIFLRVHDK
ncbi:MAG TPA: class I SAM-dependent rRNA methyltransferase [archaeon]|nr:class I SAM-dependent rRNA methyltransferase [archaeon]